MSMLTVLPDVIPDNDPQVQSSEIPADDTVKIELADENEELPAAKYIREIGYWSPPKYPSPKKRKTTKKKKQQPKKRKITFKEIPPVVNGQGEHSEVQVFEEFNPDEILANLYNTPPPPPPPQRCPSCVVPMSHGCVKTPDGRDWEYYHCPSTWWTTKCYVTCGADELPEYLQRVHTQTHPCYRNIAPERFLCDCNKSLVLATSRSEKNPGRLYLKCPKRTCKFFQWIDEPPRGLAEDILIKRVIVKELF